MSDDDILENINKSHRMKKKSKKYFLNQKISQYNQLIQYQSHQK